MEPNPELLTVTFKPSVHRLGPLFALPTTSGRSLLDLPLRLGAAQFQNGVIGMPLARV